MSTIATFAEQDPERIAVIYGNGEYAESFAELDRRSRQIATLLRERGLQPGGCVAVLLGNENEFFDIYWACMRSGVYFTPVNWHLAAEEVQYIVDNCDADVFIAHRNFEKMATEVAPQTPRASIRNVGCPAARYRRPGRRRPRRLDARVLGRRARSLDGRRRPGSPPAAPRPGWEQRSRGDRVG